MFNNASPTLLSVVVEQSYAISFDFALGPIQAWAGMDPDQVFKVTLKSLKS